MAQVNLPMALGAAYWDKQKAALAKANAPSTRLPDELKALTKLHLGLNWNDFSAEKLKTADEVESLASELEGAVKGKIKTLLAQVALVERAVGSFESEAKKDKAFPRDLLTCAAAIAKAAKEYSGDVEVAVAEARKSLEAKSKDVAPKPGAGGAALAKQTKLLKSRLLTAIATLRKPLPNARPMRFMILVGKVNSGLALAYSVGPAQEKLLKGLLPDEAPFKVLKDPQGVVVWEKNALTFVSDRLSGTLIKKVQIWLKKLLKLNLKMRVRKSSGEVEETEGEDITEDLLKVDPADAQDDMTLADLKARMAVLMPALDEGLKRPTAARLKALIASYSKQLKDGKYNDADGELDEIEALLAEGEDELDQDEQDSEEPAPHPTARQDHNEPAPGKAGYDKRLVGLQAALKSGLTGPDGARVRELVEGMNKLAKAEKFADAQKVLDGLQKLLGGGTGTGGGKEAADKAMEDWKARRAAAVNALKAVATKVAGAQHASSAKAIIELQAVIKNLTAEPSTLKQVNELQQWLTNDGVVNDVCEMDQDIRTPLLGALGRLRETLAA